MKTLLKILKYNLRDIFRGKWIIVYTLFFYMITEGLLSIGSDTSKIFLSLMNVILIVIPLISGTFGIMYLYNSREFIEMLLSHPLKRSTLFAGLFLGLAFPLCIGFIVGISVPILLNGLADSHETLVFLMLLFSGIFLTMIFLAFSFLIAFLFADRIKGLGTSLFIWLFFTIIYDGLILIGTYLFSEYPLETPTLIMTLLNPIDLARIMIILEFDISALMGYTGAVFQKFFGSTVGFFSALFSLTIWVLIPLFLGFKIFTKKDF